MEQGRKHTQPVRRQSSWLGHLLLLCGRGQLFRRVVPPPRMILFRGQGTLNLTCVKSMKIVEQSKRFQRKNEPTTQFRKKVEKMLLISGFSA